jgi:hypothetical protein
MADFDFLKETSGSFAHPGIKPGIESDSVKELNKKEKPINPRTPKNSINRMMAQVKASGLFSRPCLYIVQIFPPPQLLGSDLQILSNIQAIGLNCDSVTLPGFSVATKENKRYGLKTEYVYDKIVEEVPMTFYLSENMDEFKLFEKWLNLMQSNDGRIAYEQDYRGTICIHQCSNKSRPNKGTVPEDLEVMLSATLLDAYPKSLSGITLGHGMMNTYSKVTTSITYRDVIYKYWNDTNSDNKPMSHTNEMTLFEVANDMSKPFDPLSLKKTTTLVKNAGAYLPAKNPFDDFLDEHW